MTTSSGWNLSRMMDSRLPGPPDLKLEPFAYSPKPESGWETTSTTRDEQDARELARIGKKQVLSRNFGFLSMLGFSCTVMTTWEGVVQLFDINFKNGGYSGSFWGLIMVWIGTLASFTTMGELASMAPTAGGQYHWVYILTPKQWRKFMSYLIGWLTMTGWQAIVASGGFLVAKLCQSLIAMNGSDSDLDPWQFMLLYWAAIAFSILVNTVISRYLPHVEGFALVLHILGVFAVLLPLVYYGPRGNAEQVFTEFLNDGKFPTDGLSFMVGVAGIAFAFLGADGAVHMSEEVSNPSMNVPRAIIFSVILNGSLAAGMILAMLFCLGDISNVLHPESKYAFIDIFKAAVGSHEGALTMVAVIMVMSIAATLSFVATASRMTFAFARDRGMPFWRWFGHVEPHSTLPLWSIALTTVVALALSLISLGSKVAFNDVVSLGLSGLYSSYLLGNSLLLYQRLRGNIRPYTSHADILINTYGAEHLSWGPWRIPEPFGTIINATGVCYMLVVCFFTFWPTVYRPSVDEMNYSSVMMAGVLAFACLYYIVRARHVYNGPVIEVRWGK